MDLSWVDLSAKGKGRVAVFTVLGTLCCVAIALFVDSFSFSTGVFALKDRWTNNILIPLIIAPPFFVFLLVKLRQLAIAHDDLLVVATTDGLTSCLTRRAFAALVDGYMERLSLEAPQSGALLIIDVDHFKAVNDRFGHEHGDEALKSVASAIRSSVREIDLVGRIGGEEFGVFLPGLRPTLAAAIAERIRTAVDALAFRPLGETCSLSVSVGGTTFEQKASFTELFRQADERLYAAKHQGRNRVEMKRYLGTKAAELLN